jgi:hypothetical protein
VKFFVTILSIYFLGLSFIPCEDAIIHSSFDDDQIGHYSEHDSDHHSEDLCSPFCSCQCCHVNVVDIDVYPYQIISPEISKLPNARFVSSKQEVNYSILHPPRV